MTYSSTSTASLNTIATSNYVTTYPYLYEPSASAVSGHFYPATQTLTNTANTITTGNYYLAGDGIWQSFIFTVSNLEGSAGVIPVQSLLSRQTWTDWNEIYRPPVPQIISAVTVPDWQKKEEERLARQREAREKARSTLLTLLDGQQKEMLEKEHAFELSIDDRIYRVRPGNTVQQLDPATRKALCSFCIHPFAEEWLPEDDWAIAQKLLLEADEGEFLRIANRRVYA